MHYVVHPRSEFSLGYYSVLLHATLAVQRLGALWVDSLTAV